MKILLYLTPVDCFRPPVVMQHAHGALQAGQRVGLISPDQAEYIRVDDGYHGVEWLSAICQVDGDCADLVEDLVALKPDMAIVDGLDFPDVAGQPTEQWRVSLGDRQLSTAQLEWLFDQLRNGGCSVLLLVSVQDAVSADWEGWLDMRELDRDIEVISGPKLEQVRRRDWQMMDEHGKPYRSRGFDRDMLPGPGGPPRTLLTQFSHPQTEVLLALVSEYCAEQYEHDNPEDPNRMNVRQELLAEIVHGHIRRCTSPPTAAAALAELLDDLGELYDLVSDCQLITEQYQTWSRSWLGMLPAPQK